MSKRSWFNLGIGAFVGAILLAALALPVSAGTAAGMGLVQTPGATFDPGQGTPDPDATPPMSPTRTPTTPTNTPTPTPRAGSLSATPASTPAGSQVTIAGAGFSANALIVVFVEDAEGANAAYVQPPVDGSGNFTLRLDTTDWKPGQYAVSAASLPNIAILSRATFTLTGMPGLPNTGVGTGGRGHAAPHRCCDPGPARPRQLRHESAHELSEHRPSDREPWNSQHKE